MMPRFSKCDYCNRRVDFRVEDDFQVIEGEESNFLKCVLCVRVDAGKCRVLGCNDVPDGKTGGFCVQCRKDEEFDRETAKQNPHSFNDHVARGGEVLTP